VKKLRCYSDLLLYLDTVEARNEVAVALVTSGRRSTGGSSDDVE